MTLETPWERAGNTKRYKEEEEEEPNEMIDQ